MLTLIIYINHAEATHGLYITEAPVEHFHNIFTQGPDDNSLMGLETIIGDAEPLPAELVAEVRFKKIIVCGKVA